MKADPKDLPAAEAKNDLTPAQIAAIKAVQQKLFEVDDLPLAVWLDGFSRDEDPDREIGVWQKIAAAYTDFLKGRRASLDYKKEVFKLLIACSTMPRQYVPANTSLKILSAKEAIGIMDLFYGTDTQIK
jgi:hypothetical protein